MTLITNVWRSRLNIGVAGALLAGTFAVAGTSTQVAAQEEDERCFEETEFCISGRIREYWEQNGGLPVFGFPIGPQQEETIEDQTLQVQRFERNRLELHPENEAPYDVLLGRLGADRLVQQGRNWEEFPKSEAQEDCAFFEETGHNVCGEILEAWRANGLEFDGVSGFSEAENLALFGLPLSGEYVETLSDGNDYTVQMFERARFELHPENEPPFNVLLGLLGVEVQDGGEEAPEPAPEPAPLPEPSFNECQADPNASIAPDFPVNISDIDKAGQVVTLENVSDEAIDLTGWTMCSIEGSQTHSELEGTLEAGGTLTVEYAEDETIWNAEAQDDGALYNADGQLVSYWADPAAETEPEEETQPGEGEETQPGTDEEESGT
ncbi:MAG: cellulase family glycosylhydrolase [Chloroflexi bacterium AL-W]|nr:cellulase family glycosylhydrolase [Chloroflexi bacterium AL-N1]NOK68830.1 cellulase family glycosylhydrolase [Chloroflexi bacterium AL-N10]NOK76814.1 cellulase family glycosylhydrolase [Chloroflexi bacterium AL-N5]NOK82799.1 cellulase family glycosylhydrolase [Chloroflexi bacterium AL-W]NOK90671.1 cellulase family glycosylhydrolase [Chloroflexi bacterium AL-N15]